MLFYKTRPHSLKMQLWCDKHFEGSPISGSPTLLCTEKTALLSPSDKQSFMTNSGVWHEYRSGVCHFLSLLGWGSEELMDNFPGSSSSVVIVEATNYWESWLKRWKPPESLRCHVGTAVLKLSKTVANFVWTRNKQQKCWATEFWRLLVIVAQPVLFWPFKIQCVLLI